MAFSMVWAMTGFLMVLCVKELNSLLSHISMDTSMKHLLHKRGVSSALLQFVIEVEIIAPDNVTEEQVKSSVNASSFPLRNSSEILSVDITTFCASNGSVLQCRCQQQFFWGADVCSRYGVCDQISGGACTCINGISADGHFCQSDVDECAVQPSICGPNSNCTNTILSYNCSCLNGFNVKIPGFSINNVNNTCQDIDECAVIPSVCGPNSNCTNTIGSYNCSCLNGFSVTSPGFSINVSNTCQDVNECAVIPSVCGPNSNCTNTIGSYTCSCLNGFSVTSPDFSINVNNMCQDVNECAVIPSVCGPNSNCTNTIGSYNCSCLNGFSVTSPDFSINNINNTCQDVNECAVIPSVCGPNSNCTNTIGSYNCSCLNGFSVTSPDFSINNVNNTCQDVNECAVIPSVCGPNSNCTNTIGSYTCSCLNGFSVTSPDFSINVNNMCQDVNECAVIPSVCGPNSNCTNTIGSYNCSCLNGFSVTSPDFSINNINNTCQDVNECAVIPSVCGPNSNCTNTIGSYNCSCLNGFSVTSPDFSINNINNTCQDVNECAVIPSVCGPNSNCTNTIGSYNCSCLNGFSVTSPGFSINVNNTCQDVNECAVIPSVCGPNSSCTNTIGSYNCSCLNGFSVTWPDFSINNVNNMCQDVNECAVISSVCGPNSNCTNTIGSYNCSCLNGFSVTSPDFSINVNNMCQDVNECAVIPSVCGPNSNCTNTIGSYNCSCLNGFSVTSPDFSINNINNTCQDVNECAVIPSVCGPNSNCTNTIGSYNCSCLNGFSVTSPDFSINVNNTCQDVNECAVIPSVCGPNSNCTNTIGSYNCSCLNGFSVTWPDFSINNVNNMCQDVNECAVIPSVCGPNSNCTNTIGSYNCSCLNGFSVTSPDFSINVNNMCQDVNECAVIPSVCGPNSNCTNTIGSYNCSCLNGFSVTLPDFSINNINNTCQDVNECAVIPSVCGPNSNCTNTIGSYNCSCLNGFSVTSPDFSINVNNTCQDVNECAVIPSVCGPNSNCTNTIGSYNCSCLNGFSVTWPDFSINNVNNMCQDVNECAVIPSVCGPNSNCTNTIGSYNCSCLNGFSVTLPDFSINNVNNTCQDVNECAVIPSVCGPNSHCTNTIGSYTCSCLNGFSVTSPDFSINVNNMCQDVNECAVIPSVCGPNSNCTNTIGSYTCSCLNGFSVTSPGFSINNVNNMCQANPTQAPTTSITSTTPSYISINMQLTISEDFDMDLNDVGTSKYKTYANDIIKAVEESYKNHAGYSPGTAKVIGFRAGSVVADISVKTSSTTYLMSANEGVAQNLIKDGYNLPDNPLAVSEQINLRTTNGSIYPEQILTLRCPTAMPSNWTVNGKPIQATPDKYEINGDVLTVKAVGITDNARYACQSAMDSVPLFQWQAVGDIKPLPNIQIYATTQLSCDIRTIELQCCAESGYEVEWRSFNTSAGQCVTYGYPISVDKCSNDTYSESFVCQLKDGSLKDFAYSSSPVTLKIFSRDEKFTCNDDAYGVGEKGDTINAPCQPNTTGSRTAVCTSGNGWKVIEDNCVLNVIFNLLTQSQTINANSLPDFIAQLTTAATENSPAIAQSAATVQSIVTILNNIAEVSKGIKINRLVMENFLKVMDVIVSPNATGVWSNINSNSMKNSSSLLLNAVEQVTEALADDPLVITTGFLQLSRSVLSSAAAALAVNSTAEIFIPDTQIPGNNTVLTTVAFSNQSNFLPVRSKASFNDTSSKINAIVLLIKVKNATFNNISLTFDLINDNFTSPQCVFWNFNLFGVGGWDTSGCRPKYKSNGTVTCECNHLTSFSILMSPYVPEDEAKVLDFITYIGVGISMGSLVACLIIEILVWKSMTRTPTSYIHHVSVVNIAVCLLIADVWFIVGAAETARKHENPDACNAAVFFMHLFYLALFFWMLVSAAFFCRAVFAMTKVSKSTMRAISFSVGYVPPILIAVVTIAVTAPADNYLSENACWLRWDRSKTLLAFVVPALTIVAANLTILLAVIIKMLTRMGGKTSQVSEKHSLVLIGRCVAVLTPIFGLTWALGIGIVTDPGNYGLHVSFAFFNSLQGFFILLFGTLLDKKIRAAVSGKFSLASWTSNQSKTTSAGRSLTSRLDLFRLRLKRTYAYNTSGGTRSFPCSSGSQ
ncbi:fibrillin-2-like isoform X2 [Denticeps clupeoides]|uniref:fibrillin-2-like isoform X2 n=1 Tax=Denticeps clupeoides TaxID=299321 RepID=UPI0010A442E6|nr:fibrillin-2-like isoform X2 [Denticeps clupeoides]